ncbi:MAG: Fis family transcriptional regulator [Desulfuromonadales bacterium GWD2_61_12]|nr:MAG: Fis family transcriptional regulator [Desulfuromonadales bacterium GWC2_61_20]OGR32577.1 MAG: Fis family transcriptional regulator [Desulfuromonadales bacterium GWD2_61_12]
MTAEKYRLLIVDDEESMREVLSILLQREGYEVDSAGDGAQALCRLKEQGYDLVITDIKMPQVTGLELLAHIRERFPETLVIMVTAFSTTEEAVEAMKQGAYDYITKPFKNEEIRLIVRNALERKALRQENQSLKKELGRIYSFGNLIGKSKPMQQVYDLIKRVAASRVNVLVCGESGTGKELVAKAIHYNSERREFPFVPINCGAIPENLIESELFGHEKGSFTGAMQQKLGLFEVAKGGTIFLDEIAELPQMMQVKLLRVLQERELRRIGGTRTLPVDVRVIAATNRKLEEDVASGRFREDLFYRLNVIRIDLPALRERREDIPLLIEHFFAKLAGRPGLVAADAMTRLLDYQWPGNVRELENVIERCIVLGQEEELTLSCLPATLLAGGDSTRGVTPEIPDSGFDLDGYLGRIECELLQKGLEKSGGVRKGAAALLGITFRSIRYRLAKYGLGEGVDDGDDENE